MARLIDADALKDNMFHYAAPEMTWDKGDIEHKIDEMQTIDAIPVEWLRKKRDSKNDPWDYLANVIDYILAVYRNEQEAR